MAFRYSVDLASYLADKTSARRLTEHTILMSALQVDVTDGEEGLPYDIHLEIDVVHGRPICTYCTIKQREGGPPVMRSGLASLSIERIVRRAISAAAVDPDAASLLGGLGPDRSLELDRALMPQRGRRGDPEAQRALLEKVAAMYRDLTRRRVSNPKTQIARELGYSPSYIGALVAKARREKPPLLGPAYNGRAGEAPASKRKARR